MSAESESIETGMEFNEGRVLRLRNALQFLLNNQKTKRKPKEGLAWKYHVWRDTRDYSIPIVKKYIDLLNKVIVRLEVEEDLAMDAVGVEDDNV